MRNYAVTIRVEKEQAKIIAEEDRAEAPLTIRLFGPLDVQVNGEPLPRLRSRKGLWLLALLVLRHGRQVERAWLAGVLWPESTEAQALANLRLTLADLRRVLAGAGQRLRSPTAHTLLLDANDVVVDMCLFDAAMAANTTETLQRAVSLYRGPLLEGCAEEWAIPERASREDAYLLALDTLAAEAKARGDWQAVAEYLRQAVRLDPLREAAQRGLFEALFAAGEAAAATTVYREFRLHLSRELKAAPTAETVALFQKLQQHPLFPTKIPRPCDLPPFFRSLPTPTTTLIGREAAIGEITALLRDQPLVTLTGSAGIGKTRLAIAVAAAVVDAYPDGIAFVDLAVVQSLDGIARAVASVLGIREEGQKALRDALCDSLKRKCLLLILDNCEHLADACARLAEDLRAACPALRLLATSRQSLDAADEQTWSVPALAQPASRWRYAEAPDPISTILTFDSVQLFSQRAAAVYPAFQITAQNGEGLARLCRMLEGIPLAIELAAAWVRVLPIVQIAERMKDRLAMLRGNRQPGPARQQTLRAVLNWSYDLLSEPEQALLCRLSVFVGGWTLEAAEAIGAVADQGRLDVLSLLASLVDNSLVLYSEISNQARYRLLETTRQFAAEKLRERHDQELALLRHRDFFVAFAFEAGKSLVGAHRSHWFSAIESDYDNLYSALERSLVDADGAEAGLALSGTLAHLWDSRGYYTHGRTLLASAMARAATTKASRAKGMALEGAGMLAFYQYDYVSARACYEQALHLWQQRNDPRGIAESQRGLAAIDVLQGNYSAAGILLEQALTLDRQHDHRYGEMRNLGIWAIAAKGQGDHPQARMLLEQALSIGVELGDLTQQGKILHNLGNVLMEQERYAEARTCYERSLQIYRDQDNQMWVGSNLFTLGKLLTHMKDDLAASPLLEAAVDLAHISGNPFLEGVSLGILAGIKHRQGDRVAALAMHRIYLMTNSRLGLKREILYALQDGAFYAAAYGLLRCAACLEGAVAALRGQYQIGLTAYETFLQEERLQAMRLALGEEFAVAWSDGQRWSLEQAIAFALEEIVLPPV
jgi:predicted ATPase/DNA-binding SARP family transcriptional activator